MPQPLRRPGRIAPALVFSLAAAVMVAAGQAPSSQPPPGAPGEKRAAGAPRQPVGPPPIIWATPAIGNGPFDIESAEERNLRVVVVTKALAHPWSIAFLPGGDLLVTERPGRLRIIRNGVLDPTPIGGLPPVRAVGLQGLMEVALHPRFADNHYVYLTYHKPVGADATSLVLARGTWDGKALGNVREIFDSRADETEASRIAFGRDGMLYMTISAPGNGPQVVRSQDPNDYAGKVVRLRDDGSIPADNPFVGRNGYKPAIYTIGHRNGHGLGVNPETGELWGTEQGPNGGDEINILKAAKNYGWPFVSYGRDYMGQTLPKDASQRYEEPIVYWVPSIAVTGMTFYTGNRFPKWKHSIFVGGLQQGEIPRTGHVERVVFNDKWQELRRESLLRDLQQRIRDVAEGPDGFLYVLTDEEPGAVLRIEPR